MSKYKSQYSPIQAPECAHEHDKPWIIDRLSLLNPGMRAKAVDGYSNDFRLAYDSEDTEHKKSNAARNEANTRLRLFVDRFYLASLGHCAPPPNISK